MKLFTLISGKEVRMAPGQKKIPAAEFSVILEAAEILEKAEEETEELKKQSEIDAEEEKKAGYDQGFQEGLESFNKHLLALDEELKELRAEIQQKMLPLTLTAARKILGEELKMHPERIVDNRPQFAEAVTQHKKIIIYVNKADLDLLEQEKPEIKKIFEHLQSLSIQERDDVEPGGCIMKPKQELSTRSLKTSGAL